VHALTVETLPVGYGESHLLTIPSTNGPIYVLVDAGPGTSSATLKSLLIERGVKNINTVWISHPHPNHVDGLRSLAPEIDVQRLVWSGFAGKNEFADAFITLAPQSAWRVDVRQSPFRLLLGSVEFLLIHPSVPSRSLHHDNQVLLVRHQQVGILFAGDLSPDFQSSVKRRALNELKADQATLWAVTWPHHGDRLSVDWQKWFPSVPWVLLSTGPNEWSLPQANNPLLGLPTLRRTDKQPLRAIRLESDGRELKEIP